jgi:hypothetical protein
LFYLIVIFVLCGVLYGCNWLLKKLIKYVDYLDIASFN